MGMTPLSEAIDWLFRDAFTWQRAFGEAFGPAGGDGMAGNLWQARGRSAERHESAAAVSTFPSLSQRARQREPSGAPGATRPTTAVGSGSRSDPATTCAPSGAHVASGPLRSGCRMLLEPATAGDPGQRPAG
jgi:hypothetical protein